ncbi:hypothetical protein PWG14_27655, partial [Chromobacterium amazonense]|uniref:hypothetical protein n=1 Tax=Chromobacterium amazonense TaxID=1382803 RepID=UPI00237DE6CB
SPGMSIEAAFSARAKTATLEKRRELSVSGACLPAARHARRAACGMEFVDSAKLSDFCSRSSGSGQHLSRPPAPAS